jgi:hypothetical protein
MKVNQNLERILESAIVVNWADLTDGDKSLIHVDYGVTPSGTLDYLQVWTSASRGYWLLVCSYWMSASPHHDIGVHFDNGHYSQGFADILAVVMPHQNAFDLPSPFGRKGLLQVPTPTEEARTAAAASISDAFKHVAEFAALAPDKIGIDQTRAPSFSFSDLRAIPQAS